MGPFLMSSRLKGSEFESVETSTLFKSKLYKVLITCGEQALKTFENIAFGDAR